ncbi:hypothetical protein B0H11DRAFT_1912694 [Mycena galericulata]|nr:hypothetical protein B0H11DRAFT_1912694 [Mycena galericulata]
MYNQRQSIAEERKNASHSPGPEFMDVTGMRQPVTITNFNAPLGIYYHNPKTFRAPTGNTPHGNQTQIGANAFCIREKERRKRTLALNLDHYVESLSSSHFLRLLQAL